MRELFKQNTLGGAIAEAEGALGALLTSLALWFFHFFRRRSSQFPLFTCSVKDVNIEQMTFS